MSGKQQSESVCRSQQHIPVTSQQQQLTFIKSRLFWKQGAGGEDEVEGHKEEDERGRSKSFVNNVSNCPTF